jgi:putative hydrolase
MASTIVGENQPETTALSDINAVVGGFLRDLAFVQASPQKAFGYKRAAGAVLSLDRSLADLIKPDGTLPRISGVGPASSRVIREVLESGVSPTVERAVADSGRTTDVRRRRAMRQHCLSRAAVRRILEERQPDTVRADDYRGDLQMHSEWSDGQSTLDAMAEACLARGYEYAAVTDHSHGLRIAGGLSMDEAIAQQHAIDDLNRRQQPGFRMLKGIEANIAADGSLDLSDDDARRFEIVLAAPHSKLRVVEDQTERLLRAIRHPSVHVLAHPRGRIANTRAGIVADWPAVFAEAAARRVAIEIDGDPARQDLDYTLASQARDAGCLFAIDSDAHTTDQLQYADIALAHARLARIPAERIINCWPADRLLGWLVRPPALAASRG